MIGDLQFRLQAECPTYVVEVCAPGDNPAPISAGSFDVHIFADVPPDFADYQDGEPEIVVRHVTDFVRPLVPVSTSPEAWTKFADVVLAWVCAHRHREACHDFDAEWRELQDGHGEPPVEPEE